MYLRRLKVFRFSEHLNLYSPAADTLDLGGFYNFDNLADYQPPLQSFNPIMRLPITQTNRIICYDQIIYGDTRAEEDECFTLTLTIQDRSSIMTSVDPQRSSAVIQIVDDDVGMLDLQLDTSHLHL